MGASQIGKEPMLVYLEKILYKRKRSITHATDDEKGFNVLWTEETY